MFKISIPKPCFEGWENMLPNELGRFCNACAKTVVDFSVMSDEAVQQYFIDNQDQKICGRFKNVQLQRIVIELPQNIFRVQLPYWKRFLVAFLICFGGTFLAIDTTMAGNTFRQGAPIASRQKAGNVKADNKKSRHHRKKIRRRKLIDNISSLGINGLEMISLGYAPMQKDPPVSPFDSSDYSDFKINADTGTAFKHDSSSNQSKKIPAPQIPNTETVFVLPVALALRNPFSKKKKA